ncbi:hypothetical protein D3C80_1531060 [compost metagenome]
MIDIHAWPLSVQLIFSISPFVISMTGVAISAYVAISREFDIVSSSIRSCAHLESVKQYLGTKNFRARWMVVCAVCGMLTFPEYHIRKGYVEAGELKKIPANIRRRLVLSAWLSIIGFSWLAVGYVLIEFSGGR